MTYLMIQTFVLLLVAAAIGFLAGWFVRSREIARAKTEIEKVSEARNRALADVAAIAKERDAAQGERNQAMFRAQQAEKEAEELREKLSSAEKRLGSLSMARAEMTGSGDSRTTEEKVEPAVENTAVENTPEESAALETVEVLEPENVSDDQQRLVGDVALGTAVAQDFRDVSCAGREEDADCADDGASEGEEAVSEPVSENAGDDDLPSEPESSDSQTSDMSDAMLTPGEVPATETLESAEELAISPEEARSDPVAPVTEVEASTEVEEAAPPADQNSEEAKSAPEQERPDLEGEQPLPLVAPDGGQADNLRQISGIGPKIETLLNGLGIFHFHQIAAFTPENIAWVDGYLRFKGRIERENWLEQARILADGGETEFSRRTRK